MASIHRHLTTARNHEVCSVASSVFMNRCISSFALSGTSTASNLCLRTRMKSSSDSKDCETPCLSGHSFRVEHRSPATVAVSNQTAEFQLQHNNQGYTTLDMSFTAPSGQLHRALCTLHVHPSAQSFLAERHRVPLGLHHSRVHTLPPAIVDPRASKICEMPCSAQSHRNAQTDHTVAMSV